MTREYDQAFNCTNSFNVVQGKFDEAEPLLKRSLAINEMVLGPEHPTVATSLDNLAGLLRIRVRRKLFVNNIQSNGMGPVHRKVVVGYPEMPTFYLELLGSLEKEKLSMTLVLSKQTGTNCLQ